jgi:hypothetical protein
MTQPKLYGGVIISYEQHTHGVVELLTYHMRNRIGLTYYNHPYEIECEKQHDFLIVLTVRDLEGVIKAYRMRREPIPLIVHIDRPEVIADLDYTAYFPRVEIVPIQQAELGSGEDTLKIYLFREIIDHLEARV